jgi:hypothetical protein
MITRLLSHTIKKFHIQHHSELREIYYNLVIIYFMHRQLKEAIEYATLAVDTASHIPYARPTERQN